MVTDLLLASEREKHTDRVLYYKNGSVSTAIVWSTVIREWQAASVVGGEIRHAVGLLKDKLSERGDNRDLPVFDGLTFKVESPTMQDTQDKETEDDSGRTEEQPAMESDA